MPKLDHSNIGDIAKTIYLPGIITAIYPEDEDTPEEHWDTADVLVASSFTPSGESWLRAPIFYHCENESPARENGALLNAAYGFELNDEVILKCTLAKGKAFNVHGDQTAYTQVVVIGHKDVPKRCRRSWVLVFCGDYVTVYDLIKKRVVNDALVPVPEPGSYESPGPPPEPEFYEFPCLIEDFEPWLAINAPENEEIDTELFEPEELEVGGLLQVAGGTPNWRDDFKGDAIRGGASPKDWWNTYDFYGNPTFNHFWGIQWAFLFDKDQIADGSFTNVLELAGQFEEKNWSGPGVRIDKREFEILPGIFGSSTHYQVGYGEDEIWWCPRMFVDGMIVGYCDEKWMYMRSENFPIMVGIGNPGYDRLIEGDSMPRGGGIGNMYDIHQGIAADASQSVADGSVTIVFASLKRLNEGMFHHDSYPLIPGSLKLVTFENPGHPEEPSFESRLGFRREHMNVWVRYDNWHNTFKHSFALGEAHRMWFFEVWASQRLLDNYYVDTPIGSMMHHAPCYRLLQWFSREAQPAVASVRQDWPLRQNLFWAARQHEHAVCQVYIVHRQGLRLEGYGGGLGSDGHYLIQKELVSPWDCLPKLQDLPGSPVIQPVVHEEDFNLPDASEYVGFVGDKHAVEMTDEEIWSKLENLVVLHSGMENPPDPLRENRNEIEIMAAANMWNELFEAHESYDPSLQERNPDFESAIADLVNMAVAGNVFAPEMKVRLV